jgi:hypothetical protein
VRFVIVGGLTVTIQGSSYVTFDLDFCNARVRENLSRLAQALSLYHPRPCGARRGVRCEVGPSQLTERLGVRGCSGSQSLGITRLNRPATAAATSSNLPLIRL